MKTAVVTDSTANLDQETIDKYGIKVVPIPYIIDMEPNIKTALILPVLNSMKKCGMQRTFRPHRNRQLAK